MNTLYPIPGNDWQDWANALVAILANNDNVSEATTVYDSQGRIVVQQGAGVYLYDTSDNLFISPTLVEIDTSHLVDAAVTTQKLANLAVNTDKLADLAVEAAKLADSSVTSTKIANLAVGSAAIQAAAIGTAHIANAAITSALIANLAVVDAKIDSVTANKITAGTLSAALTYTGGLTISTSGYMRSGQTAYNTGAGFWFEYNGGTPRISIGNSSGDYFLWDGSEVIVNGTLSVTNGTFYAGDGDERYIEFDGTDLIFGSGSEIIGASAYEGSKSYVLRGNPADFQFNTTEEGTGLVTVTDTTAGFWQRRLTVTAGEYYGEYAHVFRYEPLGNFMNPTYVTPSTYAKWKFKAYIEGDSDLGAVWSMSSVGKCRSTTYVGEAYIGICVSASDGNIYSVTSDGTSATSKLFVNVAGTGADGGVYEIVVTMQEPGSPANSWVAEFYKDGVLKTTHTKNNLGATDAMPQISNIIAGRYMNFFAENTSGSTIYDSTLRVNDFALLRYPVT